MLLVLVVGLFVPPFRCLDHPTTAATEYVVRGDKVGSSGVESAAPLVCWQASICGEASEVDVGFVVEM